MGHQIHLAYLVAVQIPRGGAQLLAVFHGGRHALGQVKGIAHLVVRVAVAADRSSRIQFHLRMGAAFGQVHGGHHGLGVHQRPVGKAGKGPVKQRITLTVQMHLPVAAQDHKAVGVAVLLGKGHRTAACQGGKTALDPLDRSLIISTGGVHQRVGAADGALLAVEIRLAQRIGGGTGHLRKGLVGRAGRRDLCHVLCRGHIAVIVQAVGAGKGGTGTAQLCGTGVHLLDEGIQAAAHVPGDDAGRVVGTGDEQGIQQVDAAHRFPDAQAHGGAVGVLDILELLGQIGGHRDLTVQVLAAFQQQQGRHHLGQAGYIAGLVGILGQQRLAGIGIEQVHGLGLGCSLDGHGVYCKYRQHCTDGNRQRKHQRRQPAAERVVKHEGTP